jgi:hypothetical protein
MKKTVIFLLILLVAAPLAHSTDFNCTFPPFGKEIDKLKQQGLFDRYKEEDGITYYYYKGPCDLVENKYGAPNMVIGFINDRLYCRILEGWFNFPDENKEAEFFKATEKGFKGRPEESFDRGWIVKSWYLPKTSVKYKSKYHRMTGKYKSVMYYEPLRKLMEEQQEELFFKERNAAQ